VLSGPRSVDVDGSTLRILEIGALAAGARVALSVAVPETTRSSDSVRLGQTEATVELDDTVLSVTQVFRFVVLPGAVVVGSPAEPLLRFALPEDADLEGLSSSASTLGALATPDGIDVLGPLGPGEHEFAVRYRIPAPGGVATLDLRFPLEVPTLSVSVADTGLRIDAQRLHRLRPRQRGTRTWLLREAFHVEPTEIVSIRFEAEHRQELPTLASLGIVLGMGALLMLFIVGPLRRRRTPSAEEVHDGIGRERELVYATIRDLDHDHETGKLSDDDHRQMRAELREQAIELLRAERAEPLPNEGQLATRAPEPGRDSARAPAGESDRAIGTGRFCPSCGSTVAREWTFCSHCGGRLAPESPRNEPAA
jgi:hypothetical protein